jgi:hypothetical protein
MEQILKLFLGKTYLVNSAGEAIDIDSIEDKLVFREDKELSTIDLIYALHFASV